MAAGKRDHAGLLGRGKGRALPPACGGTPHPTRSASHGALRTCWFVLALCLGARPARAGDPSPPAALGASRLVYERGPGAETCPDSAGVEALVTAQLGDGAVDSNAPSRLRIAVRGGKGKGSKIEGHGELIDPGGRRIWENDQITGEDDCRTLIASLVLSLRVARASLALPPSGSDAGAPGPPEPPTVVRGVPVPRDPFAGPASAPPPAPPPSSPHPAAEPSAPSFRFSTAVGGGMGMTPGFSTRVAVGVGLEWPRFTLSLEGRSVLPASGQYHAVRLEVVRWEGVLAPCVTGSLVFACGVLSFGGMFNHVTGARHASGTYFHGTGGVRVGLDLDVTPNLTFGGYCEIEGVLSTRSVALDMDTVWVDSPVQLSLNLAVSGVFPDIKQ